MLNILPSNILPSNILPLSFLLCCALTIHSPAVESADKPQKTESATKTKITVKKKLFSGQVVLLKEALKKRGIAAFSEHDGQVALETADGTIIPLIANWRGRAFFQDKRLRNRPVDIIGHQQPGVPYLQVLTIYTFDKQQHRLYTDYWCEICAIPMYEIKPCDCCQGEIELRFQQQKLPNWLTKPALPSKRKQ